MDHLELRYKLLVLAEFSSVRWVKLFGSRARGDNSPSSDYDLAVMAKEAEKWLDIEESIKESIALPVDVVAYETASDELRQRIDISGKLVFVNRGGYIALIKLAKAMSSLERIIHDEDDTEHKQRDAVITRFKYVIEMFWKAFKALEEEEGFVENSPKSAVARAFQLGWISDEKRWREMLQDRNNAAHAYNERMAKEIYRNVLDNFAELKSVSEKLNSLFVDNVKV